MDENWVPSTKPQTTSCSLPDHLTELIERNEDMGHTDLVEFKIDTGDNKPVRTPAYRLPLAKKELAEQAIFR
ncbi:hypothetical protein MAR_028527 [Mya arenaria]|uniref:Uncharacterized protein n=1 Tax=Mya arenaria TaxID=6604 RepID=A0ABY7DGK8_MYAAR|nr:hypothetical protein MAR_028527 [Mya arenaria]